MKKMKVLFDYQAFYFQYYGGVSNMFTQLMKNMPKDVDVILGLKESNNIHLRESGLFNVRPATCDYNNFICKKNFFGKGYLYEWLYHFFPLQTTLGRNRLESITLLKKGDFDVFHPTFYDDYFLPYLNGKPYVLTIHDMISEKYFTKDNEQSINKRKLANNAAHIIAVSETTKHDIMELLSIDSRKITVIYHDVPEVKQKMKERLIHGDYILFVGNREGYKNFIPMMYSIKPVLNNHRNLRLVCAGKPFNKVEMNIMKSLDVIDSVIQICPSDSELRNLYSHATCFIYPSEYEGFGIPILEAYQQNCPVLLNNRSCFPEIARDAAIFFNLDCNGSDLTEVLEDFISMNEADKKLLLEHQRKRLSDFSWEKSANQLAEVYQMIIG